MERYDDPAHDEDIRVLRLEQLRADVGDEDYDDDDDDDDLAFFSSKATVERRAHVR